jgi:hypothetical protein
LLNCADSCCCSSGCCREEDEAAAIEERAIGRVPARRCPAFLFFLNNYSSFCIWFSFGSLLSRGGGDCFFFYLFSGDVDLCCLVEDEGLRAEQTTSSWADQGDFRKGMDRQPESQVRPLSKWG